MASPSQHQQQRRVREELKDRDSTTHDGWRNGFAASCPECLTPLSLKVTGTIPPWLRGSLYRNGPGVNRIPLDSAEGKEAGNDSFAFSHWFDGLTVLHKFAIQPPTSSLSSTSGTKGAGGGDGSITYMNRHLCKDEEEHIAKVGERPPGISFGGPARGILALLTAPFRTSSPPMTPNIGVTIGRLPVIASSTCDHQSGAPLGDDKRQGKEEKSQKPRKLALVSKTDLNGLLEIEEESLKPIWRRGDPMLTYDRLGRRELQSEEAFAESSFPHLRGPFSCAHGITSGGSRDGEMGREYFNFTATPTVPSISEMMSGPLGFPSALTSMVEYRPFCLYREQLGGQDTSATSSSSSSSASTTSSSVAKARVLGRVRAPNAYIHSFALTPHFFVLIIPPLILSSASLLAGGSVVDALTWRPEIGTTFHVFPREGRYQLGDGNIGEDADAGPIASFRSSEAFFFFHQVRVFFLFCFVL